MQVKYIKDAKYDGWNIWWALSTGIVNEISGIDPDTASTIAQAKEYDLVEEDIKRIVAKRYKELGEKIDKTIKLYQLSWDKINNEFSNEVEKVLKRKWEHAMYKVVLSPFHTGITSLGYSFVVRSLFENPEEQKRITAHEILMSNIYSMFYDLYPKWEENKDKFWMLNEVTATAILGLEPTLNKLWGKKEQGYDQYLSNYPKIQELKMELKKIYLNEKDFKDYLTKAEKLSSKIE